MKFVYIVLLYSLDLLIGSTQASWGDINTCTLGYKGCPRPNIYMAGGVGMDSGCIYYESNEIKRTLSDAKQFCIRRGGELLIYKNGYWDSIAYDEIKYYVRNHYMYKPWMNIRRKDRWNWYREDGTKQSYLPWRYGMQNMLPIKDHMCAHYFKMRFETNNCEVKNSAACWMPLDKPRVPETRPKFEIDFYGYGGDRIMYETLEVTIICTYRTLNPVKSAVIIVNRDPPVYLNDTSFKPHSTITSKKVFVKDGWCATETTHTLTITVDKRLNNSMIGCFEDGTENLVGSYVFKPGTCRERLHLNCQVNGTFWTSELPRRPNFTYFGISQPPNHMYVGGRVRVQCSAAVDEGHYIEWRKKVGNSYVKMEATKDLYIGSVVGVSECGYRPKFQRTPYYKPPTIASCTISIPWHRAQELTLACFSRPNEHTCDGEYYCAEAMHLDTILTPNEPTLTVKFHEPPNLVYGFKPLEATCSGEVGSTGTLTWALYLEERNRYLILARGSKMEPDSDNFKVKVTNDNRSGSKKTSVLSHAKFPPYYDHYQFVCWTKHASYPYFCEGQNQHCNISKKIHIFQQKPQIDILQITWPPDKMLYDSVIKVRCTVNFNESSDIFWSILFDTGRSGSQPMPWKDESSTRVTITKRQEGDQRVSIMEYQSQSNVDWYLFCYNKESRVHCKDEMNFCSKSPRIHMIRTRPKEPAIHFFESPIWEGDRLAIRCVAHVESDSAITWVMKRGSRYMVVAIGTAVKFGRFRVNINSEGNGFYTSTLVYPSVIDDYDGRTFLCVNVNFDTTGGVRCSNTRDDNCAKSKPVKIIERPDPPYLHVIGTLIPNTFVQNDPMELNCSADVGRSRTVTWVQKQNNKYKVLARGDKVKARGYKVTIKMDTDKNMTSTLSHPKANSNLNGAQFLCISKTVTHDIECNSNGDLCDASGVIRVVANPGPPKLTVEFDEDPSVVYNGTSLQGTCEADVSVSKHIQWLFHVNDKLIKPPYTSYGIEIKTSNVLQGSKKKIEFHIAHISYRHVGIVLSCFSYNIARFPGKGMKCNDDDKYCTKSSPFVIKERPAKPEIELLDISQPPNYMYPGDKFGAKCTADFEPKFNILWFMIVNGRYSRLEHGKDSVRIRPRKYGAQRVSSLEMEYKRKSTITLACFIRDVKVKCDQSQFFCQLSPTITPIGKPKKPSLEVEYHQPPKTFYIDDPMVLTCSANVGSKGKITWVRKFGDRFFVIARGNDVESPGFVVNNKNNKDNSVTSTLRHLHVQTDFNNNEFICFSKHVKDPIKCKKSADLCASSGAVTAMNPPDEPELSINYHDPPGLIYDGGELRGSCSGGNTEWVVCLKGKIVKSPYKGLSIETETKNTNKKKTKQSTNIRIKSVKPKHSSLQISCYTYPVFKILKKKTPCECRVKDKYCKSAPEVDVKPAPGKPVITLIGISQPPAYMYTGETLRAKCINIGKTKVLKWAKQIEDKYTRLNKEKGVQIEAVTTENSGESIIEMAYTSKEEMQLACFTRDIETPCDESKFYCQLSPVIKQIEKPGEPSISIEYHRPPATLYLDKPLDATCLAQVGEHGTITWVLSDGDQNRVIARGHKVEDVDSGFTVKLEKSENGEATSILIHPNLQKDFHDQSLLCISKYVRDPIKCESVKQDLCDKTEPLKIIFGPKPPEMNIPFEDEPGIVYSGKDLRASCTGDVGEESKISWVLWLGGKVLQPPYNGFDITETTTELDGTKRLTNLVITNLSPKHNGLTVSCFTYPVSLYPDRNMTCMKEDEYCATSPPFVVTDQDDNEDTFMNLPIDYLLFPLLWLLLVLLVAYILQRICCPPAKKHKGEDDSTGNAASDDEASTIASDFGSQGSSIRSDET